MEAVLSFLTFGGGWAVVAFAVLTAGFVYARVSSEEPPDLVSGISAYTVIVLAASGVAVSIGIARLLTVAFGAVDFDFTYGALGSGPFGGIDLGGGVPSFYDDESIQDHNRAEGIALVGAGVLFGWVHLLARNALMQRDLFDEGLEGAFEVLVAFVAGLAVLAAGAVAATQVIERSLVDAGGPSPGGAIALFVGAALLWALYCGRVARTLGVGPAWLVGKPEEEP